MSLFITFEGPEGSGKSTQARRLRERLVAVGYPAMLTREPGGTRIGDLIRGIILDRRHEEMAAATEALLFSAARAQHVVERIRPQLESGAIVVCDRFADSTYAYQGYGQGRDLEELRTITRIATGGLCPDITIYLDLPVVDGLARKQPAAGGQHATGDTGADPEWNRLDAREIAFHERVRAGYHTLIAAEPGRWLCFDATVERNTLTNQIWEQLEPHVMRRIPAAGVRS